MLISNQRVEEMLDKFDVLSEQDFEEWMATQPDSEELSVILIDLFRTTEQSNVAQP